MRDDMYCGWATVGKSYLVSSATIRKDSHLRFDDAYRRTC